MGREITFAGYLLTEEEWRELDEEHRRELLRAFVETGAARGAEDCYEAYDLVVEPL